MEGQDQLVHGITSILRNGSNRRGADGVRVEYFPGFTEQGILAEIHKMMTEMKRECEHFGGRIIFMLMYNDIEKIVLRILFTFTDHARNFAPGHWSFLGPGSEIKWHGTHENKPNGEWCEVAEIMMINFSESGHPVVLLTERFDEQR